MQKSNTVRFSLNLNAADPLHKTAIEALNAQGRHKAQFVVNAICKYIMEGGDNAVNRNIDRKVIEDIVISFLKEQTHEHKTTQTEKRKLERIINDDAQYTDSDIDDSDLSLMSESLSCFKKK